MVEDCHAGFSNWYHGWSDKKKDWCCAGIPRSTPLTTKKRAQHSTPFERVPTKNGSHLPTFGQQAPIKNKRRFGHQFFFEKIVGSHFFPGISVDWELGNLDDEIVLPGLLGPLDHLSSSWVIKFGHSHSLQGTNISAKRNITFKRAFFLGHVLVPRRVHSLNLETSTMWLCVTLLYIYIYISTHRYCPLNPGDYLKTTCCDVHFATKLHLFWFKVIQFLKARC